MADVYVSPEMGARLRDAREFLGLSPSLAAEGMRNRLEWTFDGGKSILEFERGGFMSYAQVLEKFARLYRCDVRDFFRDRPWDITDMPPQVQEVVGRLSDNDREMILRFHHFLQGAGEAPWNSQLSD